MKLRVYSDLHLEFGGFRPPEPKDPNTILILAGDIGVKCSAMAFIEREAPKYKAVIYVLGNHEFYNGVMPDILKRWKDAAHIPNLHVLEKDSVVIDGVKFCGATLWTDMKKSDWFVMHKMNQRMNDYHVIRTQKASGYGRVHRRNDKYLSPADTVKIHNDTVAWLDQEITEKTVVVTHHAPHFRCCDTERYGVTDFNYAYYTDLTELIQDKSPLIWVSGHTHKSVCFQHADTLLVSNPRGYVGHGLNPEFRPDMELDLEIN